MLRIILLRLLIGWWVIPMLMTIGKLIEWLMHEGHTDISWKEVKQVFWDGKG